MNRKNAKERWLIVVGVVLFMAGQVRADTGWYSGHHEILDGQTYGEIWMYNDCTLDIKGGNIFRLAAYDNTLTNWYGGQMNQLWVLDESIINIYGGSLVWFASDQNGKLNLYANNVTFHTTGGNWDLGWVEGKYLDNNSYFDFDLASQNAISHINVIPEPTTLLLLGLGSIFIKKKH